MNALRDGGITGLVPACRLEVGDRVKIFGHFWRLTRIEPGPGGFVLELAEPGMQMEGLRWTVPADMAVHTLGAALSGRDAPGCLA